MTAAATTHAEVLAGHAAFSFDLGTPREYTARGGWNVNCECGVDIGESGDDDLDARHRAHVAAALAVVLDAAVKAAFEALRADAADIAAKTVARLREAAVAAERERTTATIEALIEDAGPERPWVRADDLRAALRGLP